MSMQGQHTVSTPVFEQIHADADDLGRGADDVSLSNGNAGQRLACCIVGLSDGHHWLKNS